jgi:hypothetical protein
MSEIVGQLAPAWDIDHYVSCRHLIRWDLRSRVKKEAQPLIID